VGYVVLSQKASFDIDAARATLRSRLPEYMVPDLFAVIPVVPLTPNGKLDRKALPPPRITSIQRDAPLDALMTPEQRRVAELWREVLRCEQVGLHDNFFDLGGHSLLLVRLHAGLKREFDQELSLVELFQRTTVAAQADRLSSLWRSGSAAVLRAQARAERQVHG
jgi:acyl carrier protein